jgi:hypothetical protein
MVQETEARMKYFKASQPVPGKGDALVFYECSDEEKVLRQLTFIPATGESEAIPDPIVKKLYRKELLSESSGEEFERHWKQST